VITGSALLRLLDVSDGIYVPTGEGWLYLAVILDLFTRKVVGWSMREHMRAGLTVAALTMAIQRRRAGPGLIHHWDRGSQPPAITARSCRLPPSPHR
jgi:transposase InsO family protein